MSTRMRKGRAYAKGVYALAATKEGRTILTGIATASRKTASTFLTYVSAAAADKAFDLLLKGMHP